MLIYDGTPPPLAPSLLLSTFDLISFEVILEGPSSLMARQRKNLAELDLLPLRK